MIMIMTTLHHCTVSCFPRVVIALPTSIMHSSCCFLFFRSHTSRPAEPQSRQPQNQHPQNSAFVLFVCVTVCVCLYLCIVFRYVASIWELKPKKCNSSLYIDSYKEIIKKIRLKLLTYLGSCLIMYHPLDTMSILFF